MIESRHFQNGDPPHLLRLWHECHLGRGAAEGFSIDAFETLIFGQPYFDPRGLIVATDGPRIVGYVHAGFGGNDSESDVSTERGVICAAMVHPQYRRQGIGRELVRRAEEYLRAAGAQQLLAGPAQPNDPFYFGLYGGSQASGFLESDPLAGPFFQSLGYVPHERHLVYQREISEKGDPVGIRLMNIRRNTKVGVPDPPLPQTWWWMTRMGRLDSLQLGLFPKTGGKPVAKVTVLGLDLYISKWQTRAIGLVDLVVNEPEQRKGYGQAFLIEVCRRVRNEMITLVEAHAPESNTGALAVLKSAGFTQLDTGVVYRRP